MMEVVRLWFWSRWVSRLWVKRYGRRWIVPLWSFGMFLWRARCEGKRVVFVRRLGVKMVGGLVSVETSYHKGNSQIRIANPCWVSWDMGSGTKSTFREFFRSYLEEQRLKGVDYVVGAAHVRYTKGYWGNFLRQSGFPFSEMGVYVAWFLPLTILSSLAKGAHKMVRGEVRPLRKGEEGMVWALLKEREGYVPVFSPKRLIRELGYKGCSETWVYVLDGEVRGWVNGWFYTYLEQGRLKRGVSLRWVEVSRLSYGERQGFLARVFEWWGKECDIVTVPDFVMGENCPEDFGFLGSEERYTIFIVDIQGKGGLTLNEFGGFFVF